MTGKNATAAAVAVVAGFAAIQSFKHIYDLAVTHGDRGPTGALVPLSVDGLIVVATLALHQPSAPKVLAQFALWSGILATIAANIVYGLGYGVLGAVINAWPAYAFTLGVEIVVLMTARDRPAFQDRNANREFALQRQPGMRVSDPETPAPVTAPAALANGHSAPEGAREAAETFAGDLSRGELPSVRAIRREMHVGQPRAQEVRAYLSALARTP